MGNGENDMIVTIILLQPSKKNGRQLIHGLKVIVMPYWYHYIFKWQSTSYCRGYCLQDNGTFCLITSALSVICINLRRVKGCTSSVQRSIRCTDITTWSISIKFQHCRLNNFNSSLLDGVQIFLDNLDSLSMHYFSCLQWTICFLLQHHRKMHPNVMDSAQVIFSFIHLLSE